MRWDDRSKTWFKTFCVLIRSAQFGLRLKFNTLISGKDEVTNCSDILQYTEDSLSVLCRPLRKGIGEVGKGNKEGMEESWVVE